MAVLERCDEVWMVGPRVSKGMTGEAMHALNSGLRVLEFTYAESDEPPPEGMHLVPCEWPSGKFVAEES
jgi:hypothetical protein